MRKNFLKLIPFTVILSMAIVACNKDIFVTHVTLGTTNLNLVVNDTVSLPVTVYPENATNKTVGWISKS